MAPEPTGPEPPPGQNAGPDRETSRTAAGHDLFRPIPGDWPHRTASRRIACRPHRWHVQVMGRGPDMLLLHGAGGASHSWRNLMPLLAADHRLIVPDLPGQGFTRAGSRARSGLDPMAADLAALCADQGWHPAVIVGHSAGAALALRLTATLAPRAVIGINAALDGFKGVAGWLFPALARLLALNPLVPRLAAHLAGAEGQTRRLIASTGSRIDADGLRAYRHLLGDPGHVDGTLSMMAHWSLDRLLADLPAIDTPCLLITGANDRTVPPAVSARAAARLPRAELAALPRYGHLVHEEAADEVATLIRHFLAALPR